MFSLAKYCSLPEVHHNIIDAGVGEDPGAEQRDQDQRLEPVHRDCEVRGVAADAGLGGDVRL